MKKALLLVIGIVAVCFLIANADYLASFLATLKTGALVPLVVACVLMLARHLVQAASYDAAFEAVGHKTGFWHNVVLIFSLVFINTFCLFSGGRRAWRSSSTTRTARARTRARPPAALSSRRSATSPPSS